MYRNTSKMHITMKQTSAFKTAFRNSVPCHKEVHWLHHRCYIGEVHHSVVSSTDESFKDETRLLLL